MERLENCEKISWTAKFRQNFPQEISVDRVERLGDFTMLTYLRRKRVKFANGKFCNEFIIYILN